MAKRLTTRPPRQDRRIDSQLAVIRAITEGTNFGLHCFLARFIEDNPYDYQVPSGEDFEFTVKGLMRLEMMSLGDDEFLWWRRLFGTTTGDKTGKHAYKFVDEPASWKSRVLLKAFPASQQAREFLLQSPVNQWPDAGLATLVDALPDDEQGRLLLLQIHDVDLGAGTTFANLMDRYLDRSELLKKLAQCECLTTL